MLIGHDASVGDLPSADVDGGDGGDIAQSCGADSDVLHDFSCLQCVKDSDYRSIILGLDNTHS
jgi:hypothetical protein